MRPFFILLFVLLLTACGSSDTLVSPPNPSQTPADVASDEAVVVENTPESADTNPTVTLAPIVDEAAATQPPAPTAPPVPTAPPLPTEPPVPTAPALPTTSPLPTEVLINEPAPAATPTAPPVPTTEAVPTEIPPTPTAEVPLLPMPDLPVIAPITMEDIPAWLAQMVANGIDGATIEATLSLGGYLMEPNDFQVADLNGDGSDEWVMRITTITDPQSVQPWGPPGSIFLLDPAAGTVVYQAKSEEWNSPTLLPLEDFTGDGLQEMFYYMNSCGAHTCFQEYNLISFHYEGPPRNLLINPESELAVGMSYSQSSTDDRTGDGISDLSLEGGTIGSVGAGPQRARMEVYAWDGTAVTFNSRTYEPSMVRYFRLLDGHEAFEAGNYEQAILLYNEAATSEELIDTDWGLSDEDTDERAVIEGYAAFQSQLIALRQGDRESATQWLNWLQARHPERGITQAAQLLDDRYAQDNDLAAACTAVTDYARTVPDITTPLDYMGYANPELTGDTLCPILP